MGKFINIHVQYFHRINKAASNFRNYQVHEQTRLSFYYLDRHHHYFYKAISMYHISLLEVSYIVIVRMILLLTLT
jgi:hypothetical protein